MHIENNQSVLFTGDSITDCGRTHPIGTRSGLGSGYVALIDSLLSTWYPQRCIRVFNSGISGNRVIDLERRWQSDILDYQPDWLSIMIGINDVWRQFDDALNPNQVDLKRYESTYRRLLVQSRPKLKGLVLMTPFYLELNRSDPMREQMDIYGEIVKQLAHEFDAIFVDTQAAFDHYLAHRPTQSLCGDRVHPNQTGHLIIAKAFLTAMQLDWSAQ